MLDALDNTDADDDVRCVIFTGAGRAFCAGADLASGRAAFKAGAGADIADWRDGGGWIARRIFASNRPVIAAVNGPAVGIGASVMLPMDIRIAAEEARFGFVYTRRGIVPESCSLKLVFAARRWNFKSFGMGVVRPSVSGQ